jgi:hypothetical protein
MAIRKLQHGYPHKGYERDEKRESQSPQSLEAASPLRPQVQRHPENKTIKIQDRISRLDFDKAVVCPEAISKLPNGPISASCCSAERQFQPNSLDEFPTNFENSSRLRAAPSGA